MVGSIDPRCETLRGTHWPKKGRVVVWNSRRGTPSWPAVQNDRINRPDIWMQAIRSDRQKKIAARGPSTYGSRRSPGRRRCLVLYLRKIRPARVSMDGRESICCVHPSRRLLRKLLRMRSVFTLTQHLPKLQTFVGMSVTPRIEGHLIFKNPDVLGASGMRVALPTLQFNVSLSRSPSEIRTQGTSSSHAQAADPLHR